MPPRPDDDDAARAVPGSRPADGERGGRMSAGDDEGAGRGPADGGAHADGSGAPARTGVDHGA
ncbi:hypothetical protein ADL27_31745, partial [Streptomyces sp. NRRL F-6602]